MSDAPDLSLVTTEELMEEIRSRHSHVLCLAVRDHKLAEANSDVITRYLKGSSWTLIGLAEIFTAWAKNEYVDAPDTEDENA